MLRHKTDDRFTVVKRDTGFAGFAFAGRDQGLGRCIGVADVRRIYPEPKEGLELQ